MAWFYNYYQSTGVVATSRRYPHSVVRAKLAGTKGNDTTGS